LQVWSEIKDYKKLDFSTELEILKPTPFSAPVEIEVSNLVFSYPDSISEIVNVEDLRIESGSVSAIVGRSGAGKSTFVELLLNIYEPQHGEILFNGKSIPEWRIANPGKIGFVPQDNFLLQDTFINNVCLGTNDSDIDLNKVNELVDILGLRELVDKLPSGLYSQISGIGISISGGEKQRISIARAMYFNSDIIILDEASSALDAETEKKIISSSFFLDRDKTLIFISHKPSFFEICDRVYEIKDKNLYEIKNKVI
jgi:ABC-type bacteriocin/lantibiotic exporter with double-glycine peptidase domain